MIIGRQISLWLCKFPSPGFFKEACGSFQGHPKTFLTRVQRYFVQRFRDSPWGQGKGAFKEVQCKMQNSSTCLEDTITPPRRTASTTLCSTLFNNKTPLGAILLLLLLFTCSLPFQTAPWTLREWWNWEHLSTAALHPPLSHHPQPQRTSAALKQITQGMKWWRRATKQSHQW